MIYRKMFDHSVNLLILMSIFLIQYEAFARASSPRHWYRELNHTACSIGYCCSSKSSLDCLLSVESEVHSCPTQMSPFHSTEVNITCSKKAAECSEIDLMAMINPSKYEGIRIQNCALTNDIYSNAVFLDSYRIHVINERNLFDLHYWRLEIYGFLNISSPEASKWTPNCPVEQVALKHLNLMKIPKQLFMSCARISNVDLSFNKIYSIGEIDFWLMLKHSSVEKLILDNNNIRHFGDNVLTNILHSVARHLRDRILLLGQKLGYNLRKHLSDICDIMGTCVTSEDARTHTLEYYFKNGMKAQIFGIWIHLSAEYSNSMLTVLSMKHNQLTRIPDAIFGLTKLKELHLANNRISNSALSFQGKYVFTFLTQLQLLDLENNLITEPDKRSFEYLKNLISLNLAYNKLKVLPQGLFQSLTKLSTLNLAGNALSQLSGSGRLEYLRLLNVSHNYLQTIDHYADMWPYLEIFDLSYNRITSIAAGVFRSFTRLRMVMLNGNLLQVVPATSFITSPRIMGNRVQLKLFSDKEASNSQSLYLCDCQSVFNAIAHEEANSEILSVFNYPTIVLPAKPGIYHCLNTAHQLVSVTGHSSDYAFCSVPELSCPAQFCSCCNVTNIEACPCIFRCPTGCSCTHTITWNQLNVDCHNIPLQSLPQSFAGRLKTTSEHPLVTQLSIVDADIQVMGSESTPDLSCLHALSAVQSLTIESSNLHRIHSNAFVCFRQLRILNLTNNLLTSLPDTPALLGSCAKRLQVIDVTANQLNRVSKRTFEQLDNLVQLNLTQNPFHCDCQWEDEFFKWTEKARRQGVTIDLPSTCTASKDLRWYGNVASVSSKFFRIRFTNDVISPACRQMRIGIDKARMLLITIASSVSVLFFVVLLAIVIHKRRFSILKMVDDQLGWVPARRLAGLSIPHNRPIDVALVFHERQTREEHEVVNFITATGRNLVVRRIAYYMPGALVTHQLESLADNMAVCICFVSPDLLNDAFLDPFRAFLSKCRRTPRVNLVPIYPSQTQNVSCFNYEQVQAHLRHYNGLRWRASHFWDRLRLVLPPARPLVNQETEDSIGLIENLTPRPKVADVVVASHESQLYLVRCIYERYRTMMHLLHYRHGAVFGINTRQSGHPESFLELALSCRQFIVILSPELLNDFEAIDAMASNLRLRLQQLPFVGSLILLRVASSDITLSLSGIESMVKLLTEAADSIVQLDIDVSAGMTWEGLDDALTCSLPPNMDQLNNGGMSESEYNQLFFDDRIDIQPSVPDTSRFIINSLEWRQYEQANGQAEMEVEVDLNQQLLNHEYV